MKTFFYLDILISSYWGMYAVQAFCHSITVFIISDRAMHIWNINNPMVRQRFHFIVVLLPVFSFPLYQAVNPYRGSIAFRMNSLFDTNRWLSLEIFGILPLWVFFIFMLLITTAIFIFQELVPVLKSTFESKRNIEAKDHEDYSIVRESLAGLPAEKPEVVVLEDDDYVLFSTAGKDASVFMSTGLVKTLNKDELQAAIAHETAHIARNKKPMLITIFFFRMIMFFNPVVLLEFRRIVHEEEKICDDMAVALTQKPHALSDALKKLYHKDENIDPLQFKNLSEMKDSIEEYSHNVHIEGRIRRLEKGDVRKTDGEWLKLILVIIVIMGINYFVV